jgi:hypothetical protein
MTALGRTLSDEQAERTLRIPWLSATPLAALESLGSATNTNDIPADPGDVVRAVIAFHSFNILMGGAAVEAIAVTVVRSRWPVGVSSSLGIVAVLDAGLIFFLLAPGYMKLAEGAWGPVLFVISVVAAWAGGWRPKQF